MRNDRGEGEKRKGLSNSMLGFFTLVTLLAAAVAAAMGLFCRLQTVEVYGCEDMDPAYIVQLSGLKLGENLFSLKEKENEVADNLARDPSVAFVSMTTDFPSTLHLYVKVRKAAAWTTIGGLTYVLDTEGTVMKQISANTQPAGMPEVKWSKYPAAVVGCELVPEYPEQMETYRNVVEELRLQQYEGDVKEINLIDPEQATLLLNKGITVRLGTGSDMRAKIGAIRTVIGYVCSTGNLNGMLDVTSPTKPNYQP